MARVFVVAFVAALAAGLGATVFFELRGASSWGSRRLIKVAVRLLPESIREEHEEMWLADIDYWKEGALGRLVTALGMIVAAARIGHRERQCAPVELSPQSEFDGSEDSSDDSNLDWSLMVFEGKWGP